MKTISASIFAAACATSVSAFASASSDLYGRDAGTAFAQRRVQVDASTGYVKVKHGDVVTFTNGSDSVTWYFVGIREAVPLSKIFPAGGTANNVLVHVEPEPDH